MKSKVLIYAICIFIILILQSTILSAIEIMGIKPNLLFVFIVSVALLRGKIEGAYVGFFVGLVQDISSGRVLGFYALLGIYIGYIIGSINRRLYRENFIVIIFFTFISSIVYELVVFIFSIYIFNNQSIIHAISSIIFPEALYNVAISIFMYVFVIRINEKFSENEKRVRKY